MARAARLRRTALARKPVKALACRTHVRAWRDCTNAHRWSSSPRPMAACTCAFAFRSGRRMSDVVPARGVGARVLIVDDEPVARRGLRRALGKIDRISAIAECA